MTLGACGARDLPELPPAPMVPEPDPAAVESVVYFLGDPGQTYATSHPILLALRRDIDRWSAALPGDTTVAVIVMGDVVYPLGLHSRDHPAYPDDSTHVAHQVALVGGEAARRSAVELFVAGNHDWGREEDWEGRVRLHNLDRLLASFRARGYPVDLVPDPGQGGPTVVDMGDHLRLLLLDTAWWLMDAEDPGRDSMIAGIEEATRTAGDRHVVISGHHPYQSAGAHGGTVSLWSGLGIQYALTRAGAILQDLNSIPYRALRDGIRRVGRAQEPALLFVGGHDHSLQIIQDPTEGSPVYSVVAGSASKLTDVGHVEGMLFRRSWPGYARLFILEDGGALLTIEGAPPEYLECPDGEPARQECMEQGADAYRTLWSDRIR